MKTIKSAIKSAIQELNKTTAEYEETPTFPFLFRVIFRPKYDAIPRRVYHQTVRKENDATCACERYGGNYYYDRCFFVGEIDICEFVYNGVEICAKFLDGRITPLSQIPQSVKAYKKSPRIGVYLENQP